MLVAAARILAAAAETGARADGSRRLQGADRSPGEQSKRLRRLAAAALAALLFGGAPAVGAAETVLEARRLHLGRPGVWEWEEFKDRAVDGEKLELNFQARANATEQTLRIWQANVKLNWPVLLNGKRIGRLTTADTALESVHALPPGTLRDGINTLLITPPPAPALDDIEIGPVLLAEQSVKAFLGAARIEVAVDDAANGRGLPCRLTLTRPDGTLQPLLAEPAGAVATRVGVAYTQQGRAVLSVPPGEYDLHAGRGFEWSVETRRLRLAAGGETRVALQLRREVDTRGWIAVDSHIHTATHSGHGDAGIEERMLTIAGEGIELAVATDHNHHVDFAPAAAAMGVAGRFATVVGNEVTTRQGHFNIFPVAPGAAVPNHHELDWSRLLPGLRATPGVRVITLNHPRDLHSGFVPLGGTQFNPATGRHRDETALRGVDALEVITSAAMQSDVHRLYHDWFALLNRGHRIAAVGSSDTHDVSRFILGQGRTYVAARDDDPAGLDLEEVWRSYQAGRLLVSLGLLAHLTVDGRFGVGDLATGLGSQLTVEVTVSGPAWVRADRVELFANGHLIREQTLGGENRPGVKARVRFTLPKPAHDVHLVAIATGPGVREPFWEIPRPYQPADKAFVPRVVGSTNPVWIDADNDGKFSSALDLARRLVERVGNDAGKLREAAKTHDQAVAVQVETLVQAP